MSRDAILGVIFATVVTAVVGWLPKQLPTRARLRHARNAARIQEMQDQIELERLAEELDKE